MSYWSCALPENIVSGSSTPTIPNAAPPSVDLRIGGIFAFLTRRPTSRKIPIITVVTAAASTPRPTPASKFQE